MSILVARKAYILPSITDLYTSVQNEVICMSEGRGVAMAILGIVALIAVVGLILLFRSEERRVGKECRL